MMPFDVRRETTFARFQVGDSITFDRAFNAEEFQNFSALSGDRNPFHHDTAYAIRSGGQATIVPLHMTLAPLSMIAGMDFPGEPSLYLGHEVRASKPIYYGEILSYSARIQSINESHQVLVVRVLAMRGSDVVIDAVMTVQARSENWNWAPLHKIRSASDRMALVTGSSGEIGQAIALALARKGWHLLLQDRGPSHRRAALETALLREGVKATFASADLVTEAGRLALMDIISREEQLELVVHTASPPVHASAEEHVAVGFSALKSISDAAVPTMLTRQKGSFILIGSAAVDLALPGWENYTGAKAMAMQLVRTLDLKNCSYGIQGHTLAVGLVATAYSQAFRSAGDRALLPGQVADEVLVLAEDDGQADRDLIVTATHRTRGRFGFKSATEQAKTATPPISSPKYIEPGVAFEPESEERFVEIVRNALKLPRGVDLAEGGLGVTPGWDSLKHIELILSVEAAFKIRFSAAEIERTHRFDDLQREVQQKQRLNR